LTPSDVRRARALAAVVLVAAGVLGACGVKPVLHVSDGLQAEVSVFPARDESEKVRVKVNLHHDSGRCFSVEEDASLTVNREPLLRQRRGNAEFCLTDEFTGEIPRDALAIEVVLVDATGTAHMVADVDPEARTMRQLLALGSRAQVEAGVPVEVIWSRTPCSATPCSWGPGSPPAACGSSSPRRCAPTGRHASTCGRTRGSWSPRAPGSVRVTNIR
jgi:hypothetical protein